MDFFTVFLLGAGCFITGKTFFYSGKLIILCYKDMKLLRFEKEINWHYKLGLYETIKIKMAKPG